MQRACRQSRSCKKQPRACTPAWQLLESCPQTCHRPLRPSPPGSAPPEPSYRAGRSHGIAPFQAQSRMQVDFRTTRAQPPAQRTRHLPQCRARKTHRAAHASTTPAWVPELGARTHKWIPPNPRSPHSSPRDRTARPAVTTAPPTGEVRKLRMPPQSTSSGPSYTRGSSHPHVRVSRR